MTMSVAPPLVLARSRRPDTWYRRLAPWGVSEAQELLAVLHEEPLVLHIIAHASCSSNHRHVAGDIFGNNIHQTLAEYSP